MQIYWKDSWEGRVWGKRGRSSKDLRVGEVTYSQLASQQTVTGEGRIRSFLVLRTCLILMTHRRTWRMRKSRSSVRQQVSQSVRRLTLFNMTRRGQGELVLAHEVEAWRNISRETLWSEKLRVTVEDQSLFLIQSKERNIKPIQSCITWIPLSYFNEMFVHGYLFPF